MFGLARLPRHKKSITAAGFNTLAVAFGVGASCSSGLEDPGLYAKAQFYGFSALTLASIAANFYWVKLTETPPQEAEPLDGALKVLHDLVLHANRSAPEPKLRMCVYLRDPQKNGVLRRVSSQIGDDGVDDEPREISVKTGLVGRVALTGKPQSTKMGDNTTLADFLLEWNFEPDEVAKLRQDRRSWSGVPLQVSGNKCLGVLFCDSADPDFFLHQRSRRQQLLRQAAIPIARVLKDSYNSLFK